MAAAAAAIGCMSAAAVAALFVAAAVAQLGAIDGNAAAAGRSVQ